MNSIIIKKIIAAVGSINGVYSEKLLLNEPFEIFASKFAHLPGTVVLLSGGNLDCARYDILATSPCLTLTGRNKNITININGEKFEFESDPFIILKILLTTFNLAQLPDIKHDPVITGLFGYLSYDLKDRLEELPRTSLDDLCLPHVLFFMPEIIVVRNRLNNHVRLHIPERTLNGVNTREKSLLLFKHTTSRPCPQRRTFSCGSEGFHSNFPKEEYMQAVIKIREYIAAGHVYQVNLSQRFEATFQGDPYSLFLDLFGCNPAPFFSYINGGNHHIVSSSPERFIKLDGNHIETRPIKGTRPRGRTPEEDTGNKIALCNSEKDNAELSMIVDLLRNDIGKICTGGSVKVSEHKRIESYDNVYHLVSIVNGIIHDKYDAIDVIKAAFPGGSITGCPKIRAMEIIDEMEPCRRHIYTGSIGYLSFHKTMDLSIAIRTATVYGDRIFFSVGGGIVFDSQPQEEYDETLHKGKSLTDVFTRNKSSLIEKRVSWLNGKMVTQNEAVIPVDDLGFQYGFGFFETIRVNSGEIKFLNEHITRFNHTWETFFVQEPPDLDWNEIIKQVLSENRLMEKISAVKIIATKGSRDKPPFNHSLMVSARNYIHRLENKIHSPGNRNDKGLHLVTYPEPHHTPLAEFKTLNYLYYYLAGKWAIKNGGDEALIINPDGTVSETNSANILIIRDGEVIKPLSPHSLPGIMEQAICRLLVDMGYRYHKCPLKTHDIQSTDQVIITNSLIGAVPVLSIDEKKIKSPGNLWKTLNNSVL